MANEVGVSYFMLRGAVLSFKLQEITALEGTTSVQFSTAKKKTFARPSPILLLLLVVDLDPG
jgi:hypothetical protein